MALVVIVDCSTGTVEERESTPEETAASRATAEATRAQEQRDEATRQADRDARQALAALGRGTVTLTPAQLSEAVRRILALIDVR